MANKEWVRVKDKRTGHEYSVVNVNADIHEVLDKPAARRNGRPLAAKPNISRKKSEPPVVEGEGQGQSAGTLTATPPAGGNETTSTGRSKSKGGQN